MFVRRLFQFSSRLPERLPWRVQCASYCDKQSDKQSHSLNKPQGDLNPVQALRIKEAEHFLATLDEDGIKKMEEIKELMKRLRLENKRVPDEIPLADWKRLITELHTYSSRVKFLSKLFLDEMKKKNEVMKKQVKQKERREKADLIDGHPQFSIHYPLRDKNVKGWNGIQAMKSDVNVVFDLDFEQNSREQVAVFDQIQLLWADNLRHLQPLNIHLTSINSNERLKELFQTKPSVFVNTHEEYFTDVFDQNLVYLSPDGPQMKHFDPTCTYIIGGIADIAGRSRLTFGTARKLGVRCASLPIKTFCDLSIRNPTTVLTLNCVYGILQDMYLHHLWTTAFRNNLRKSFVLYEDTPSDSFIQQRNEMIEKKMFRTFKRNQNILESTKYN